MELYFVVHHIVKQLIGCIRLDMASNFGAWHNLQLSSYCGIGNKVDGESSRFIVTEKLFLGLFLEIENYFWITISIPATIGRTEIKDYQLYGYLKTDRLEKAQLKEIKKQHQGAMYVVK